MIMPAAPPQTMELAASPRIARKPSSERAADAGLPGTTRLSACMVRLGAFGPSALSPVALTISIWPTRFKCSAYTVNPSVLLMKTLPGNLCSCQSRHSMLRGG